MALALGVLAPSGLALAVGAARESPASARASSPARAAAHPAVLPAASRARGASARRRFTIGHSAGGRPIRALRLGDPAAPTRVLVVGCIHGNECAGRAVTGLLARRAPAAGVQLWLVPDLNPDGSSAGTRQNGRGVDLNRNFPRGWRARGWPGGAFHAGSGPLSEPESRAAAVLVRRVRPQATVWFHQALRLVNLSSGADPRVVRSYARRVGLPARRLPNYPGTASRWQNHAFPGTSAFVVEVAAGPLSPRDARRHARAVRALARPAAPAATTAAATAPRPKIVGRRIPFGARRRRQMTRYARRHYGIATHRLRRPRVIVEHVTAGDTFASAFATFAANARDPELRELPGVCAHFVIDRDGTIYQLVSVRIMCRHTVGLNHVALGVEHVGRTDAEVMGRPRQRHASLRLTRWLQERHGIARRDVIGHAESLRSRHHHERVARLRRQTHADFAPATMQRYRRLLGAGG